MAKPRNRRAGCGCLTVVALVFAVAAVIGGSSSAKHHRRHHHKPHSLLVRRSTFHGTWPFTVASGVLSCIQPPIAGAIIFTPQPSLHPRAYGINGTALDDHYPDVKPIWRRPAHPLLPGQRVDIGDMIDRGLRLCGPGATP